MINLKDNLTIFTAASLLFLSAFITTGCNDDIVQPPTSYDASSLLINTAENVITGTYEDLNEKAVLLVTAIENFRFTPSVTTLESAKTAWRNTRVPWEMSEGFLFGPVSTKGIDPSIDSWPVNTVDLDAVLSGTATLTKTYIDGLEGTLKGFHTIEYLLWGVDGNKTMEEFFTREHDYLVSLAQSLQGETAELFNSWDEAGENFQVNISEAGLPLSIYPSQSAVLQELLNGMIGIADEVANGKINDPLSTGDITLEESRFSNNSKSDFANNIRSIQNIYNGTYGGITGDGFKAFVAAFDEDLSEKIENDINLTISSIESIPGTFTEALISNPADVDAAQDMILNLKIQFEIEVTPLLEML